MAEEIIRTRFPKQRDFVRFVLRSNWADIYRVQLSEKNRKLSTKILTDWVNEHIHGRWSKSDGNEVFYFERIEDATLFRLDGQAKCLIWLLLLKLNLMENTNV